MRFSGPRQNGVARTVCLVSIPTFLYYQPPSHSCTRSGAAFKATIDPLQELQSGAQDHAASVDCSHETGESAPVHIKK